MKSPPDDSVRGAFVFLVHPEGVEPSTSGAEIQRSIQLSYGCIYNSNQTRKDSIAAANRPSTPRAEIWYSNAAAYRPVELRVQIKGSQI